MGPTIRKRSKVWQLFVTVVPSETARCLVCNAVLRTSGGSTSGLAKHLAANHNQEWNAIDSDADEDSVVEIPFQETAEKKRKSHVWEYCVPSKEFKETAECKLCGAMLKTTGSSTSSLTRHLATSHQIYKGGGRNSKAEASNVEDIEPRAEGEIGDENTIENEDSEARHLASQHQIVGGNKDQNDCDEGEDVDNERSERIGLITLPTRRSYVWKFFARTSIKNKPKCKLCGVFLSSNDGSTSTLRRHLMSKHNISDETAEGSNSKLGVDEAKNKNTDDGTKVQVRNEDSEGDIVMLDAAEEMSVEDKDSDDGDFWTPGSEKNARKKFPKRQKSRVWKYFVKLNKDKSKCKLCGILSSSKLGSTSALARHLASRHNIGEDNREGRRKFRVVIKPNIQTQVDSDGIQDDNGGIDDDIGDISTEQYSLDNLISCEDEVDVERRSHHRAARSGNMADSQSVECFVCHTEFYRKSVAPCHQEEYNFLLKEMLQIPIGKSMDYLNQLERPEKWICLCTSCRTLVEEGVSAKAKIIHLQLQLEKFQKQILKKMTSKPVNDSTNYRYPKKQRQVVDDIKKFVNSRMYTVLNYEDDNVVADDPASPSGLDSDCENNASERSMDDTSQIQCGLCNDDKVYVSMAHLAAHTSKAHDDEHSISSKRFKSSVDKEKELHRSIASKSKHCTSSQYCYQCPNCPKVKRYPLAKFVMHLAIHQKRPYQCTVCFEFLPTDEYLQERHWNEKHSSIQLPPDADKFVKIKLCLGRIWKCDSCLDGFFSEEDRDDHEIRCLSRNQQRLQSSLALTERKPHECLLCDMRFRNVAEWRIHRVLNHPEMDCKSCYYCDESFYETTVEGLETRHDQKMVDHMTLEHLSKRLYTECESCGLVFDCGREHKVHMTTIHGVPSTELYVCVVCGINYNDVVTLRQHVHIVHFQSGLSVCDLCGVNFLKLELLHHHKFISHGIIPEGREVLNCPKEGCTFQGIFKQKIQQHIRNVHDENKQTFTCRFCRKIFKERSKLNNHLEIHMNKNTKPHQCEICGNAFRVKSYLRIHKKLKHEGRTAPNRKRKYKSEEGVRDCPATEPCDAGHSAKVELHEETTQIDNFHYGLG